MSFVNVEQLFSPKKFSPKYHIYSFFQTVSDVKSSKFYKAWVSLGFGSTACFAGFYLKYIFKEIWEFQRLLKV